MNTIKAIVRHLTTLNAMRRIDKELFRLEVIATNAARSIAATDRVIEAIEDGSMS